MANLNTYDITLFRIEILYSFELRQTELYSLLNPFKNMLQENDMLQKVKLESPFI